MIGGVVMNVILGIVIYTAILLHYDKDYLATSRYFQRKFIRLNKSTEKEVYTHFTNATGKAHPFKSNVINGIDTTILRNVMQSVQDTIMNNNFRHLLL